MKNPPYVTTRSEIWRSLAWGVVVGIILSLAVICGYYEATKVPVDEQKKALRTCNLPESEGEMTVFVGEKNTIKCWRWK
jgi:hypothetical protein